MPSTPRMIEIERKASQPGGPALTREEVAEWHRLNVWPVGFAKFVRDACRQTVMPSPYRNWWPVPDYSAANRFLDATGYKTHG